jgi:hypothetical protein
MLILKNSKQELLFVNKKKQKNFDFFEVTPVGVTRSRSGAKVFCFFFSKKKVLLSYPTNGECIA